MAWPKGKPRKVATDKAEASKDATTGDEAKGVVCVRVTTDRGPWFDGGPMVQGVSYDVPEAVASILLSRGWAEEVS